MKRPTQIDLIPENKFQAWLDAPSYLYAPLT